MEPPQDPPGNANRLAAQKEDEANGKIVDGVFVYYGEMTLDSLCRKIGVRTTDVMKSLLMKGKLVTLNTMLNDDMIAEICLENDLDSRKEEKIAEEDFEKIVIKDDEKDLSTIVSAFHSVK